MATHTQKMDALGAVIWGGVGFGSRWYSRVAGACDDTMARRSRGRTD